MKAFYQLAIDDIPVTPVLEAHSWNVAFGKMLYIQMQQAGAYFYDINNVNQYINQNGYNFSVNGAIDDGDKGIVVGTGDNAEAFSDYKLETKVAHGNGSGQLRHLACVFNNLTVNSDNMTWQLVRSFVNNSGATITIGEIGLYTYCGYPVFALMARDLLGSTIDVEAGKTLTVTYTFTVSA